MPRAKTKAKDDLTLVTPSSKKRLYMLMVLGAVVAIILLMLFIKKTATNLIVHANDRPAAIQQIMKACTVEMEKTGLKNAQGMAFFDDCNKREINRLDAKK